MSQQSELAGFMGRNAAMGDTERTRRATQAELYYLSRQHDEKTDWDDKTVPVRARKPRIIVPLYRMAIEKVDRFLWSGHRFPSVVVSPTLTDDEDEATNEIGPLLDHEEAEALTSFAAALVKNGRLKACVREMTTKVLVTTSAAIVVGVQAGYLNTHVEVGKHCTPTFSPVNPREVIALEIKYKFCRDEPIGVGMTRAKWYWYRRVIDEQRDVTFEEQEVSAVSSLEPPEWVEDPARTLGHGFGFCPVRWVRSFGDSDDPIDGKPMIDPTLYPLLDAISYTVSMRNRAVMRDCDPKQYAAGFEEEDLEDANRPGKFIIAENPQAKLAYVEAQGAGSQRAAEETKDLIQVFREITAIVNASPEVNDRNVSGVAMALLYAPLVELASDLRVDLGDDAFCDLVALSLRICTAVVGRGEDVWIPGVKKAAAIMQKAQLAGVWLDPQIELKWPAFFQETEADRAARVDYTNKAKQGGLIAQKTAIQHITDTFDVADVAAEIDAIEDEADEAMKREGADLPPGKGAGGDGKSPKAKPDPADSAEQEIDE